MAALCRLSRSARRGLIQLCLSHVTSAKPIQNLYTPSHSNSCNYGAGIFDFEFSRRPSFNLTSSYSRSVGQNFYFSTSSGVADGSNCSSGRGKDRDSDGELKRTSETSWIDLYLPQKARPYAKLARLDKPIGIWLLTWPCMWSITMAAEPGNLPNVKIMALFACGALLLRGAGCTINDLLDQDIDVKDKEDDLKVGVKSTALRFGDTTKEWLTGFGFACISSLAVSGFNADLGWLYYTFLATASGQLAWQIYAVDLSNRTDCNKKFVSNKWFGALVFSGILFGKLAS